MYLIMRVSACQGVGVTGLRLEFFFLLRKTGT